MKHNRLRIFRPRLWAIRMVIKDIENYIDWIKTVKKEASNPKSLFHKFNMKYNIFYILYFTITLPQEDDNLPDNIKRMRVVESLAPVHRYLDEDLQFAEYIVPEFSQFYKDDKPTLTYAVIYRFAFKRLSLGWVISRSILLAGLTWVFYKYSLINMAIEWMQALI